MKNASRRGDSMWPGGPRPVSERARPDREARQDRLRARQDRLRSQPASERVRGIRERARERTAALRHNVRRRQAIVIALTVAVIGGGVTFAFAAEGDPNANVNVDASASPSTTANPAPTATAVPSAIAEAMKIPNDQGMDPRCLSRRAPHWCHLDQGGPTNTDFVDIRTVARNVTTPARGADASTGSFISVCGRNTNGHRNPDNFIVAPGTSNGAHHTHDYVGNLSADGNSTNDSLSAAGTTCRRGDLSTYYWPVLRRVGTVGADAEADGGGKDLNVGQIVGPASVQLQFRGNATAKVVAMPRFIRVITGDAKATTNGPNNARAKWTCTGFTNRTTTKYPLCPRGSQVQRLLDFPSCWDGVNTDSANHRAHVLFTQADGSCPTGTQPIPALRMTLTYSLRGATFALDSFPDQLHNPLTDHGDFVNVMPDSLMATLVSCINRGRRC